MIGVISRPDTPRFRFAATPARVTVVLLTLASAACVSACDALAQAPGLPASRDSARVKILTVAKAPAYPGTRLVSVVDIRGDSGGDGLIGRIADVDLDHEGRVYVLDQSGPQVKVFGGDGRFQRVFARGGAGPGEMSGSVNQLVIAGRSLLYVPDPTRGVAHAFTLTGTPLGSVRVPGSTVPLSWAADSAGRLVGGVLGVQSGRGGGVMDSAVTVFASSSAGMDTVTRLRLGTGARRLSPVFYGPTPVFGRLDSGDMVAGLSDRFELRLYDRTGRLVRSIRRDLPSDRISDADQDVLLTVAFQGMGSSQPALIQRVKREGGIAATYPAFARLIVSGNEILVERAVRAEELTDERRAMFAMDNIGSSHWDAYGSNGVWLYSFDLPPGLRLRRVRNDRVVADGLDGIGAPLVRVFRLVR